MFPQHHGLTMGVGTHVTPRCPLSHCPSPARVPAVQWLGAVDLADADRVLLVVVAHAGPLRLAVLGMAGPRLVRGPVREGHHRDPLAVLGGERLVLDVPGHGPRQGADPGHVVRIRVRVRAQPVAEDGDDLAGLGHQAGGIAHAPIVLAPIVH